MMIVLAAFAVFATAVLAAPMEGTYHLVYQGSQLQAVKGTPSDPSKAVVVGKYERTLLTTGWDVLHLNSSSNFPDHEQAYAAGYLEGMYSADRIYDHHFNSFSAKPVSEKVENFLQQHMTWLDAEVVAKNSTSDFWYHVALQWAFWNGLYAGSQKTAPAGQNLTRLQLLTLTSLGDLFDLGPGVDRENHTRWKKDWRKMPKHEFDIWAAMGTHCSSLFKLTGDMQDIYFGHVAWYTYHHTMRIYKHITLNYNHPSTIAKTISMSSYPGIVSSFDDFYLMDSGFVTIETSLGVYNLSAYDGNIRTDLLLYWMRVMVANRMARTAPEWTELIARRNSGTYNNQWMVLNLNLFEPGKDLKKDTMWVAEQVPGLVASQDVTDFLRYGYYPSYNVPMNKTVFDLVGNNEAVKLQGPEMNDYQMAVRAQIFRRDQGTVTDLDSYKHIMQYNDYEVDPISNGNPLYAISSRVDLDRTAPQCFGAYDAKVSSWRMWRDGMKADVFSGPTPQQPQFAFNHTFAKCGPHRGLPEVYNFGWQHMKP